VERTRVESQLYTVFRLLGDIVDDATDGARTIAQRGGSLQDLDAVHALYARIVVARIADKEPGRDRHAVFQYQGFVIRRAETAQTDIGHDGAFFFRLDGNTGDTAQHFFGGAGLFQADFFQRDNGYRTRLAQNVGVAVAH